MFGKNKVAALVAEFLGTGVLTLLILSVQRTQLGIPLFVGLAAGLAVLVMVFAVGRVSGGHFNPAITLGMWTARKTSTVTAVCYVAVQFLGAYGAFLLYRYFAAKNAPVLESLKQNIDHSFDARIMISELVGTAIFAFAMAAAVYQRFTTALTATTAGLGLAIGIMAAGTASIGILNPAVALGVHAFAWWTYALGPVLGAVVGINLYGLLFADTAPISAAVAGEAKPLRAARPSLAAPAPVKPARKTTAKRKTTRAKK